MKILKKEENLQRPKYNNGQVLTANDLADEQQYFIEKFKRHNRYLHGWGIISGLTILIRNKEILVEPGYAIDCAGNEIVLNERLKCDLPAGKIEFWVSIRYDEKRINPIQSGTVSDASSDQAKLFNRIQEDFQIELKFEDPNVCHEANKPGSAGCGHSHAITIAYIKMVRKVWKIILKSRQ